MSAIVTERFILRPQVITDYDVWYPMYSDPKIFHLVNAPGFTPEEAWNRPIRVAEHVGYRIYDECLYKGAECLKLECLWDK